MEQAEFNHNRLVQVYDVLCPWSRDDDFFLALVGESPGSRVLDLGCGTGRFTLGMAAAGHTVTGIDPAAASLAVARTKPGADRVTWLEGTSSAAPTTSFDLAIMTAHVAQFIVDDHEWARTLADLHAALVPGGRLIFDTRDPEARGWEQWNRADSFRRLEVPGDGVLDTWAEVTAVRDQAERDRVVDSTGHYAFDDGEELLSNATFRFRSEAEVRSSLQAAGFVIDQIYGGWNREPVGAGDGELLVIARRP